MNFEHIFELEVSDKIFEVEIEVTCYIENDGIGAYDYGSERCYDNGQDYPVSESYKIISVTEVIDGKLQDSLEKNEIPAEIRDEIEKYFDNNQEKLDSIANDKFANLF